MDESTQGSADGVVDHFGQLSRGTSSVAAQTGMGEISSPKQQAEAKRGLRLQLASNPAADRFTQDRSSSETSSPRGGLVRSSVSNDSTNAAVPPWESNSAAAWVKQKSLDKTQSAAAQLADWRQQEEEEQSLQQQSEPDQDSGISPASGKGRALGSLHIEVGEAAPQDGLQEWTESGLDDIAAAVAQYTGASPDDLMVPTDDLQQQEQLPPKQIAQLRKSGSKQLSQSPTPSAGKAHATQQDRTGADSVDPATVAGAGRGPAPQYANAQEQMEAELEAAMAVDNDSAATGAPVYANAFEQMEAELEAAMAADAGQAAVTDSQTADLWAEMELDAAKAADDAIGESKYRHQNGNLQANAQRTNYPVPISPV